jgi:hypothetical protein
MQVRFLQCFGLFTALNLHSDGTRISMHWVWHIIREACSTVQQPMEKLDHTHDADAMA